MKIIAFTVADKANEQYAKMMINSFHKFHPDIEVKVYGEEQVGEKINYYRATPMFARTLIKDYDLVVKLDADQIITGSLDHVFNMDYDMGGVTNYSRSDIKRYGVITCADIPPEQYFNCGFVAMKSAEFIEHWWNLCNSYHFNNFQYKEQDLLNIMIHYGNYNIKCFDRAEGDYHAWHGLVSKGEWHRMELRDFAKLKKININEMIKPEPREVGKEPVATIEKRLILPKADDNYPEKDKEIKIMHWAGGGFEQKMNYRTTCTEEVITYLDGLIS